MEHGMQEGRLRLALVDVSLADCDRLDRVARAPLEIALVVVREEGDPVARWAELGGYPCATDLRRLSAAVIDAVAVGAGSMRRDETLALASLVGLRAAVLAEDRPASPAPAGPAGETAAAGVGLDEALARLFGPPEDRPA